MCIVIPASSSLRHCRREGGDGSMFRPFDFEGQAKIGFSFKQGRGKADFF